MIAKFGIQISENHSIYLSWRILDEVDVNVIATKRYKTIEAIVFTAHGLRIAWITTQAYDCERGASDTNSNIMTNDEASYRLD